MAWSDEARRRSLEVRRAKAKGKKLPASKIGRFSGGSGTPGWKPKVPRILGVKSGHSVKWFMARGSGLRIGRPPGKNWTGIGPHRGVLSTKSAAKSAARYRAMWHMGKAVNVPVPPKAKGGKKK